MIESVRYLAPALWLLLGFLPGPVPALAATAEADFDPAFRTEARFTIGGEVHTAVSALASIAQHPAFGAGYHRLTIGFHPFRLTKQQTAAAAAGNYQPIEDRVTADYQSADYKSHVQVLLNIYDNNKVAHVDITVPGSSCTVTPFQTDVPGFLQVYRFEGGRLRLKSRGSFACFAASPDFHWDFDVDLPVFEFSGQ